MADNSRAINRVFTRKVISDLVQDGKSDVFDYVVKRYVENPSEKTHGQLISEIYARLNQQQRNEYFYMKSSTDFLIILAPLRKCRNCLEYQAFPAFCVSEDTPHIMAYRSLIWRSKVVKP